MSADFENLIKTFENPDETRIFDKGRFEIVHLPGLTLGRATYEPGWRWSTHVGVLTGATLCQVSHVGMVISGTAMVLMEDGTELVLNAGDLFQVKAGHDSWVIGDKRYVSIHFVGVESYAKH